MDDLSILELLLFGDLLSKYKFMDHVASDVGIDENFIPGFKPQTQKNIDTIAKWTAANKMKLNKKKKKQIAWSSANHLLK